VEEPQSAATPELSMDVMVARPEASTFRVTKGPGVGFVAIYDVAGREIKRLELPTALGTYLLPWHGVMASGRVVPSGVYFARAVAGPISVSRKFVVLR
jgi:hypothetical protein